MSTRSLRAIASVAVGAVLAVGVPAQASAYVLASPSAASTERGGSGHITTIPLTGANGKRTAVALEGISADGAVAARADGAGRAEIAVRSKPLAAGEFVVAAVTWAVGEDLPDGATVQLRVLEKGGWSDWLDAAAEDGGPGGGEAASGTDPFITGGAAAVQVRVTGDPADLPSGMELNLIPLDASHGEAVVPEPDLAPVLPDDERGGGSGGAGSLSRIVAPTAVAPGEPSVAGREFDLEFSAGAAPLAVAVPGVGGVVTRSEWGADDAYTMENWTPRYAPLQAAVVHHTAGTNNYTASQSAGIVKAIFNYHTYTRGWGDIGYNFLVDRYGQVFEGRQNSLQSQGGAPTGWLVEAGHARGYNRGSLGISAMGDFTLSSAPDPTPIVSAMAKVIAWKFRGANLDAGALSGFLAPDSRSFATYAAGEELPRIFGHGDVALTSCPGGLYGRLGELRTLVRDGYTRAADTVTPLVNVTQTPSGMIEITAVDAVDPSPEVFYTTDGSAMYWSPATTVPNTRYTGPFTLAAAAILSIVAVDDAGNTSTPTSATVESATCGAGVLESGNSAFYLNDSFTGSANTVFSYGLASDVVHFGDWDGDGIDTPLIQRGNTFLVRNVNCSGQPDFTFSYGNPGDVILAGDWDGDGRDTLAVRRGATFYVKNSVTSGVADTVFVYGNPEDIVLVGDWDGDGIDTLAVRRVDTFHVKNAISSGVADYTFSYGNPGDFIMVGDWDGNGTDTLAVRRGITYYLRNATTTGVADVVFAYGNLNDDSFTGDWDSDGRDTIGIRRAIP